MWAPDQAEVLDRKDVLVFTSGLLNKSMALTGPLDATLYVSTSKSNDTDFTVKLMDVYPDGRSILIQDGSAECGGGLAGKVLDQSQ